MTTCRAQSRILLALPKRNPPHAILAVGEARLLLLDGQPWAVWDGADVYFPDLPDTLKPSVQRHLNTFYPEASHTRLNPEEFTYQVASTLMRYLRPLTRVDFKALVERTLLEPKNAPD